jgi:hypothetical protein
MKEGPSGSVIRPERPRFRLTGTYGNAGSLGFRPDALNPTQRRRFVATTDSDHNYPIFPNLAKNMKLDGPNQLWVADITYVTIATRLCVLGCDPRCLVPSGRRLRHQPLKAPSPAPAMIPLPRPAPVKER